MKKIIAAVMAVLLLAGCSGTPPGEPGQTDSAVIELAAVSETAGAGSETTGAETSGIVSEAVETTVSETKKASEEKKADYEHPVVIPADQVYELYPIVIKYPEKQSEAASIEMKSINETFYNDHGYEVCSFSADYPVVSGIDEAVSKKINDEIWEYVNTIYEEEKAADVDFHFVLNDKEYKVPGLCEIVFEVDANSGNILSLFSYCHLFDGMAAHGMLKVKNMSFDLRTGELIDFGGLFDDKVETDLKIYKAIREYTYLKGTSSPAHWGTDFGEYISEEMAEYVETDYYKKRLADGDIFDSSRMTVKDGCLGYYLEPYEYGSFADGIRCIQVPLNEISPYLNETGRSFFEGCTSAESEPANVIEYRGSKYIDICRILPDFESRTMTGSDFEFIGLFKEVGSLKFKKCRNIDFSAIAECSNIKTLYLTDCTFDDISPLYGSAVKTIYGSGKNLSNDQKLEFLHAGGSYVDHSLVHPEKVSFKGQDYVLPDYGDDYAELELSGKELNDIDHEFIAHLVSERQGIYLTFTRCTNIDFERLAETGGIKTLTLNECGDIDFAGMAKIDIDRVYLYNCDFDDISPLYGSGIKKLNGAGENISQEQADEFEKYGGWVDSRLAVGGTRPGQGK